MANILLIEADRLIAQNASKILKRAGHRVEWQVDPQAAMDSADKRTPDLIIIDLILAGHGGLEFLYELRSYPEWESLPVVLYSQISQDELDNTRGELEDLKVAAFVHKPTASLDDLAVAVEQCLQTTAVTK